MMKLLLVQHGQAKTDAEDPARPLNTDGIAAAEKTAKWLSASKIEVDEIRHSGKKRAEETASILSKNLSPRLGVREMTGLNPMDDVYPMAESLRREGHPGTLMLVGHLPFMSRLTSLLVAGDPKLDIVHFHYAGVVCLGESDGRWSVEWALIPDIC